MKHAPRPEQFSGLHTRLFSVRRRRPHATAEATSSRLLHALLLALLLSLLMFSLLQPLSLTLAQASLWLAETWSLQATLRQWPLELAGIPLLTRFALDSAPAPADWFILSVHSVITLAAFALSWASRSMPVRYAVRSLCLLHAIALILAASQGAAFPHTTLSHTRMLGDLGLLWLALSPLLLGIGFYLVERNPLNRLLGTLIFISWQILALPLKIALHALLIGQLSHAAIPLLFLVTGPVLDVLLLSALYTWIMSWPVLALSPPKSKSKPPPLPR